MIELQNHYNILGSGLMDCSRAKSHSNNVEGKQ